MVSWAIWLTRNAILFQGKSFSPLEVAHKIKLCYEALKQPHKPQIQMISDPPVIGKTKIKGYFDGTSKSNPGPSGAGGVLYLSERVFGFKMGRDRGTNN